MKFPKLLLVIILLFLITRLYQLGTIPPALYWDEASIGYNAYSIATTGRDEWGDFLPVHFRAFGEFKLPIYIYSVTALVKVFGLHDWVVRLPAVIFSLGTIILIYLLTLSIFKRRDVALLSAFLLTISPFMFIFSRTGFEATAGLMFYLLGVYLFLKARERRTLFIFSTLSFIFSMYSYNSFRVITPFAILFLVILFLRDKISIKKYLVVWAICFLLLIGSLSPIFRLYKYDAGLGRLTAVGLGSQEENKQSAILILAKSYLSHFDPNFLFFSGDRNLRSQQADFGQHYFVEFPLFLLGIFFILRNGKPMLYLPLFIILTGPIPAALTKESPHALRSLSMAPFLSQLSAIGVVYLARLIRKERFFIPAFVSVVLVMFAFYLYSFLLIYPIKSSEDWQYAYKQVFTEFSLEFDKFDKVIVSDEFAQPYIFALYYLKYSPHKLVRDVERASPDKWGFSAVSKVGKFQFKSVTAEDFNSPNTLIFATSLEVDRTSEEVIKFLDGNTALLVFRNE